MWYNILAGIFVTSDLCSTIICGKFIDIPLFGFGEFATPAGTFVYPVTFLISDIITEVYGQHKAKTVVIMSFCSTVYMFAIINIIDNLQIASCSLLQTLEFSKVFHLSSMNFIASSIAFLFSQFLDIKIFSLLKSYMPGRYLWLRNGVSTITAQIIDTLIFFFILTVMGVLPVSIFWTVFLSTIFIKIIWAILDTPLFYLSVFFLKHLDKNNLEY